MLRGWTVRALALLACLAPLACHDRGGRGGEASAAPDAAASAAPVAHPKFTRHAGIASGLFRAANQLALPPSEQASIDRIEANLRADDGAIRAALRAFRADLVAGVRAGKLDPTKLGADDDAVDKAFSDHLGREAEALDALHALLTPEQRAALVAAVRAKQGEREGRTGGRFSREADGGVIDWARRRLDRLSTDLSLDPAQQRQAAAVLAKPVAPPSGAALQARWDARKKRYDALLTAFAADTLDTRTLDLDVMPGKSHHEPMDQMVAFFTALVPILHPDQRDKLATSLDRPFGTMGRPSPGGGPPVRGPADDITFPFSEPAEMPGDDPSGR